MQMETDFTEERGKERLYSVSRVAEKTGVSVRTLHHYDSIDLLKPTCVSEAGYRLYDEKALEQLQTILFFRELRFSLSEIRAILSSPDFDRRAALREQLRLLKLQRAHLDGLIALATNELKENSTMKDFTAFDRTKLERYAEEAKARWGKTDAYRAYESTGEKDATALSNAMQDVFSGFAALIKQGVAPDAAEAQAQVQLLMDVITKTSYPCTKQILSSLGEMYVGDPRFQENIDLCGAGTASYAGEAIRAFCAEGDE